MAYVIKNKDTVAHVYAGVTIQPDASYSIQAAELLAFQSSDSLLADIGSGKAQVNDGSADITGTANQLNYLLQKDTSPKDSDGSPLSRIKVTTSGWHYQLHGIEFETSKLNSMISKKVDNTDYGFAVMKFYKLDNGSEVQITGDDLNQEFLDANCIKTVVEWEPTHDLEVIGGMLKQSAAPETDLRLWVVGVPDVPAAYGGSKPFCVNVNLKYTAAEEGIRVDGRAPKFLQYSAQNHTNKLQLIFRHNTGIKHKLHMIFELFKA
jgi:hypothetical protein